MRPKFEMKFVIVMAVAVIAGATSAQAVEMTPAIQAELDKQKAIIATWAANPVIVNAVVEQNRKGPIPGMDNARWKITKRSDPVVIAFQSNPAGQFLKAKIEESKGVFTEAFLSGVQGEKVAFFEKTTWYIHKGMPKFDVPFTAGKAWQGKAEFDESAQTYQIQISTPVLQEGRPIGVLVVGVNLSYLEKVSKK